MQNENVKAIFGDNEGEQVPTLFEGLVFFLSNEVPREPLEIMILSFGGRVIFDTDNFESEEYANDTITHVITDRDPKHFDMRQDR